MQQIKINKQKKKTPIHFGAVISDYLSKCLEERRKIIL